jgi:hypothetical protein
LKDEGYSRFVSNAYQNNELEKLCAIGGENWKANVKLWKNIDTA